MGLYVLLATNLVCCLKVPSMMIPLRGGLVYLTSNQYLVAISDLYFLKKKKKKATKIC